MENQQLDNFFSSTNPFDLLDPHQVPPALDDKASAHDYNNWEEFIAPPTVHRVTSTFHQDPHNAPSSSLHGNFLANTEDELQAAATLFNHAQPSYTNGRLHTFPEQPAATTNFLPNVAPDMNHTSLSMGMQPHGLLNQRMASLVPNHNAHALDAQFPAQWTSKAPQHNQSDFGPPLHKVDLKRSYTFGTDNSFNSPSGYAGPNAQSAQHSAARHSIHDVEETHQHLLRAVAGIDATRSSSTAYHDLSSAAAAASRDEDDEQSDDSASQEEQDDRPAKKRKKSAPQPGKETPKKAARNVKARKASLADDNKRKRAATTTNKTHRENLTEEQKRNNHILSEQKRRDLIKQGYKDLNEVVPAVRGGGLSKSQILVEAATFLEKLIEDNIAYRKLVG
jgi:hypothetical protein